MFWCANAFAQDCLSLHCKIYEQRGFGLVCEYIMRRLTLAFVARQCYKLLHVRGLFRVCAFDFSLRELCLFKISTAFQRSGLSGLIWVQTKKIKKNTKMYKGPSRSIVRISQRYLLVQATLKLHRDLVTSNH